MAGEVGRAEELNVFWFFSSEKNRLPAGAARRQLATRVQFDLEQHPTERDHPSDKDARQNNDLEHFPTGYNDSIRSENALDEWTAWENMMSAPIDNPASFRVTQRSHDLEKKVSIVTIFWNDGSGKRLGLTVPFGTEMKEVREQAEAAVQKLATELTHMSVNPTGLE
jgi:hypothetical protein